MNRSPLLRVSILTTVLALVTLITVASAESLSDYASHVQEGNSIVFTTSSGQKVRLRPYTDYMVRIQATKPDKSFYPDNHYEMIYRHDLGGTLTLTDKDTAFEVVTGAADGIKICIKKSPMRFEFFNLQSGKSLLKDKAGINWPAGKFGVDYVYDDSENYCGLGHEGWIGQTNGEYLWVDWKLDTLELSINLKHKTIANYRLMGLLSMPFYLSSKGYGLFYNTMYKWVFSFFPNFYGANFEQHESTGEVDYLFIIGPEFGKILNRYVQLTGKPRFLPLAQFGLALSQHEGPGTRDENWWKTEIKALRDLGNGMDHAVMDNYWRAGGGSTPQPGTWGNSQFEWRSDYYPNPAEFAVWLKENGLVLTLDFNRRIAKNSWGWNEAAYNIPGQDAWPDLTKREAKDWLWELFWRKSFNPALKYPGDAIWIDEMELLDGSNTTKLSNGRTVIELRNYTSFLVGKAITGEGWDNEEGGAIPGIGETKRPFVWTRSGCPGAQRYVNYWTGDVPWTYVSMKGHFMAMLRAGMGGFPYFNHDAGGFAEPKNSGQTDMPDDVYKQWLSAWGSFTPIWRPHGYVAKRWPQRRNQGCKDVFQRYNQMRYKMMPYIYSYAYEAHSTGMPMARAMVIDYQNEQNAWKYDYQYMWGSEMLVAPNFTNSKQNLSIWLPGTSKWYDYWTDQLHNGNQVISYSAEVGVLPILVHEGSIIPEYEFAKSTAWLKHEKLILHVYPGKDGSFQLYEDDGVTEKFRTNGEKRTTAISWNDKNMTLAIEAAKGTFSGAPAEREYVVYLHASTENTGSVNNVSFIVYDTEDKVKTAGSGLTVKSNEKIVAAYTGKFSVNTPVSVHFGPATGINPASLTSRISRVLLRVSPNMIAIKTAAPGMHSITVTDMSGKTVALFSGTGPQTYVWNSKTAGVYFIRSERSGGNIQIDRVVVWR